MVTWLSDVVLVSSGVGLVWALVMVVLGRALGLRGLADRTVLGIAALVELALVVQLVVGLVLVFTTDRDVEKVTFVGYLLGAVVIMPVALAWALADRSRWGPGVLAVGFVTVPVMILRMDQIWNAGG